MDRGTQGTTTTNNTLRCSSDQTFFPPNVVAHLESGRDGDPQTVFIPFPLSFCVRGEAFRCPSSTVHGGSFPWPSTFRQRLPLSSEIGYDHWINFIQNVELWMLSAKRLSGVEIQLEEGAIPENGIWEAETASSTSIFTPRSHSGPTGRKFVKGKEPAAGWR